MGRHYARRALAELDPSHDPLGLTTVLRLALELGEPDLDLGGTQGTPRSHLEVISRRVVVAELLLAMQ